MKMRGPRSRKHIDEDAIKQKNETKKDLRTLLICGDEDGYVALLKELKPHITPEELVSLVLRFREERANLSRGTAL
jgi:hypothetical protein